MPPGRKPDHRNLQVLRGTDRKDRKRPDPPPPPEGQPETPEHLTARGREFFALLCTRLKEQDRLSTAFTEILGTCASRLAQEELLEAILDKEGWQYEAETKHGETMIRPHPAASQLAEAQRHKHSLLAELGLTPASLHKVGGVGAGKKKNAFESLG